jgi:predicted RNase H-like HicB family nuclease
MEASPASVRERASVEQYQPPVFGLEEPMWIATDEETGCSGVGKIEEEAVANLLSLVATHESAATDDGEYLKLPGQVREKTWADSRSGVLGRLLDRF